MVRYVKYRCLSARCIVPEGLLPLRVCSFQARFFFVPGLSVFAAESACGGCGGGDKLTTFTPGDASLFTPFCGGLLPPWFFTMGASGCQPAPNPLTCQNLHNFPLGPPPPDPRGRLMGLEDSRPWQFFHTGRPPEAEDRAGLLPVDGAQSA